MSLVNRVEIDKMQRLIFFSRFAMRFRLNVTDMFGYIPIKVSLLYSVSVFIYLQFIFIQNRTDGLWGL